MPELPIYFPKSSEWKVFLIYSPLATFGIKAHGSTLWERQGAGKGQSWKEV